MKRTIKHLAVTPLIILFCLHSLQASFFYESIQSLTSALEANLKESISKQKKTGNTSQVNLAQDIRNCGDITIGSAVSSCTGVAGTIGGNVYEDADYDGALSGGVEAGIAGIMVNLYDDTNIAVATTTTDVEGNYLFEKLSEGTYRVEFLVPDAINCWAKPSIAGLAGNTTVQFIEAGNCANLGLADPNTYCGTEFSLATTCFIDGEPSLGGSSGEGDVLVAYPYHNPTSNDISKLALNKEIGTAWGLAYDKITQNFYTGAMLKRHAGFGPLGIGGIYRINYSNPSSPAIEDWLNLEDLGINVGADPRDYTLPATAGLSNTDPKAFAEVGKIGIGDVDISSDGKTLYAMNLNNNGSLVIIDVATKSLIQEVPVGDPGCGAPSDVRPWGIEIYNNEAYIGLICSGQSAGATHFNFFVLKLENGVFVEVFSASLDYEKGYIYPKFISEEGGAPGTCKEWEFWTDDFADLHSIGFNTLATRTCRPQPILSDIEFDKDGSMILAFMDRTGHQTGYNQYNTISGPDLYSGYVGGDILRVHNNDGTFELENEGTTANGGGCGLNGQGPGGGEYYCGEAYLELHLENSLGALAISGVDNLVALNLMDPANVFSGGTAWLDNTTGVQERVFELYNSHPFTGPPEIGTFGKAAGLGDIELLCGPAPIEIGNLIWIDINGNGIQDPSEKGLDDIDVKLIKGGVEVASTLTANGGYYYFSQEGIEGQSWVNEKDKVKPFMDYTVQIDAAALPYNKFKVTVVEIDSTNFSFLRDNDGVKNGNYVEINLTTGGSGCISHNYDIGITPSLCLGNLVWEDTNNDGLMNNGEAGLPNIELTLCSVGADGAKGTEDDAIIATQNTDANGNYLFTELCQGDYFVKVNAESLGSFHSSTGTGINGTDVGLFEPANDPDNDKDNLDDGTQMGAIIMSSIITLTLDEEPNNDADTDVNTNTTLDFGLFRLLSLGDKVWEDVNNNGVMDTDEKGINGIELKLFQPGADGLKNTADDITVGCMTTNFNGCYGFDKLFPGQYYVKLTNGIPQGTISSDGSGTDYTGTGIYESGIDPDFNSTDSDDNGIQMGSMIMSELIELSLAGEPTDDADGDSYTNTTLDFALFALNEIMLFDPCNCLANESSPGAGDGQFSDKVTILSTISGENWTLKSSTGLYSFSSPAPPAAPNPIPIGTAATENGTYNGRFKYELEVKHVDGQGYSACFTNGTSILNISNKCDVDISCVKNIVAGPDATPTPVLDTCAQNFVMGADGILRVDTLKCCDNKSTFSDDGTIDGLYQDTSARTDVYTICTPDPWKVLKFVFKEFDVAPGDTLYVYDGRVNTDPLIGKYSGAGVSQTGGWLAGNCDPSINSSGCITFEFKTDGDKVKGTGWNGNFECSERNIKLTPPNDLSAKLACDETYQIFTINPATVTADCGTILDTQFVRIYDTHGNLRKDTCLGGTESFQDTFAIGSYLVRYKLKSDTVKTAEAVINVQGPALVCNDNLNIPLGSACAVMITPDDLLENPCDTITDSIYYYITLKGLDKNGKDSVLAQGGGKAATYPMVSKDMLEICGDNITATIEKRYYENSNLGIANNGVKTLECSAIIHLIDQSAPTIENLSTIDTFKMCLTEINPTTLGISTPKGFDNCSEVEVEYISTTIIRAGGVCDTTIADINWQAIDACGNTTNASQRVVIARPAIADLVKRADVTLKCEEEEKSSLYDFSKTGIPGVKIGKIVNGVLNPTDTLDLSTEDYTCGYILTKKDIAIDADCGTKVFRYWDVLDWCNPTGGLVRMDTQLVQLKDTEAPTFTAATLPTRNLALAHYACTYNISKLDKPEATDKCSEPSVRLDKVYRIEEGEKWEIPVEAYSSLNCDSFQLRWVAEDACHEQTTNDTITEIVLIEDVTKPSAVCVDQLNISLPNEWGARVHVDEVDGGSYDACGLEKKRN